MRGYQRRVIYMKNTGSDIFSEAYFVLNSEGTTRLSSDAKMVDEAKRIIRENSEGRRSLLYRMRWSIFSFLLGAFLSTLIVFLFFI